MYERDEETKQMLLIRLERLIVQILNKIAEHLYVG